MGGPGTPGTRKVVAFAGIDDDDDESDTESEDQPTVNSFDEEVWVKQPETSKGNESVATTGVIIAGGPANGEQLRRGGVGEAAGDFEGQRICGDDRGDHCRGAKRQQNAATDKLEQNGNKML